jgi:hypothetical protein
MGLGWQEFQDVTFRMVALDPTEALHSVIVRFGEGFVNLCSISVEYSKQEPPVTWGALEYSYGYREYPGVWGYCVNLGDGVAVYPNSVRMDAFGDESTFPYRLAHFQSTHRSLG